RFAANRDRVVNRAELDRLVGEVVATRTRAEWIEVLDAHGIPSGPINSVSEALSSPQTLARDMVIALEHPAVGAIRTLGLPIRMSGTPASVRIPAPTLGAHTEEVLSELGYTAAEIETLRAAGTL